MELAIIGIAIGKVAFGILLGGLMGSERASLSLKKDEAVKICYIGSYYRSTVSNFIWRLPLSL